MKVLAVLIFACVATLALASDSYGYKRTRYGNITPYNNAERQEEVNEGAEYIGRSSGTAEWDGVPGTGNIFRYGPYGYGIYKGPVSNRVYGRW